MAHEERGSLPKASELNAPPPPKPSVLLQGIPERRFDAYAILTMFKTAGDIMGIVLLFENDFVSGGVVGAIGLIVAVSLRFFGNNFMISELKASGITTKAFSTKAIVNTSFGTRFGFKGEYDRIREDFSKNIPIQAGEVVPEELGRNNINFEAPVFAPSPKLYGGSETLKPGPRTLTAMAEVIQQGFLFYPILILLLQFGFNGDVKRIELVLISGLLNYAQIMCWLVSPSLNSSYGWIYLSTWISFTVPFLILQLFAVLFDEFLPDSFYTRRQIYGWFRVAIVVIGGVVGLSVYNYNMARMIEQPGYKVVGPPALLVFMRSSSLGVLGFEIVSVCILLANEKRFFFNDDDANKDTSRLSGIVLANTVFAGWSVIVASIETLTVFTALNE